MPSSVSTIGTPMSFRQPLAGRPPTGRTDSPASRKRRAAAATAAQYAAAPMSTCDSFASSSVGSRGAESSDQSSGQLRPAHSFTGGMRMFDGFDDDLDNFAQYVDDNEDDDDDEEESEQGEEVVAPAQRVVPVSFESDDGTPEPKRSGGGIRRLFGFDKRRRKKKNQEAASFGSPAKPTQVQTTPQFFHQPQHLQQSAPPALISPLRNHQLQIQEQPNYLPQQQHQEAAYALPYQLAHRPHSTRIPTSTRTLHNPISPTEIHYSLPSTQRSRSVPDYRTYNEPKSTLPRLGSFELDIDTIPACPRMAAISPFTQEDEGEPMMIVVEDDEEDPMITRNPSWRTASTTSVVRDAAEHEHEQDVSTAMVPYATGGVELVDQESSAGGSSGGLPPFADYIDRQDSWNRRLDRSDIYHRHYVPSRQELEELQELEDYLGIFSAQTKSKFSFLWRQLVPSLDVIKQRNSRRSNLLSSQASTSSMSTLSAVTNHPTPVNGMNNSTKNKTCFYSIVLKRGPIQFEEYTDFHCELILLTRGFVVARPNYQYIPRFQAGDMWTSVVQVQPTNPLSITLSCTSRSTSSHLTLTQLKQQQQYGCYTYEISCETPQEQASWLEALRRVVIQAHDSVGTNEKEMGGLGWQYRVVYEPFFTEAVTGDPIQKEKILAGSTGHLDLNALDSFNSYSPLHYATRSNHVNVMRFLLEAGADVHVGDGYGRTPMYYAELHQLPEATIQLLEHYGAFRTKKPVAAGLSAKAWRQRSCRLRLCMAAMILLLLACATGAVLWYFGMLEFIGIGSKQDADPLGLFGNSDSTTAPSSAVVSPAPSGEPTVAPIPQLSSRVEDTISPSPTRSPLYIKTPLPTPTTTVSPSMNPTTAAFSSGTALFQLLESASFDAGASLRTGGSPQQRAFLWLNKNANLDSYTNQRKIQRYALATFFYSTNGENWADNLRWVTDEDECVWFNKQTATGFSPCQINTSNSGQKTFTSLDLSYNNLSGKIPPEIGLLSGLLRLDLDGGPSGFLTGPLPNELGYLNVIQSFSARGNQLTGTLPEGLGNWRQVNAIDLSFNRLSGALPASIGSMPWLTELTLEMNDFSGLLPTELGLLSNLFKLALGGNKFEGPVLPEIGFLTKLRYLYLELNNFSSLPTEIGLLENLNILSAFENNIQGAVPSEIGNLKKLGGLLLRSNSLTSYIPSELGLMESVQSTFDLSFNQLIGPVPSELGRLTLLRSLYLQSNSLSGALPNEISFLSQLNTLRVESNNIVGMVPPSLCMIFNETYPNFYADCTNEVSCACCTYCCTDGGGCSCQHAGTAEAYLC